MPQPAPPSLWLSLSRHCDQRLWYQLTIIAATHTGSSFVCAGANSARQANRFMPRKRRARVISETTFYLRNWPKTSTTMRYATAAPTVHFEDRTLKPSPPLHRNPPPPPYLPMPQRSTCKRFFFSFFRLTSFVFATSTSWPIGVTITAGSVLQCVDKKLEIILTTRGKTRTTSARIDKTKQK